MAREPSKAELEAELEAEFDATLKADREAGRGAEPVPAGGVTEAERRRDARLRMDQVEIVVNDDEGLVRRWAKAHGLRTVNFNGRILTVEEDDANAERRAAISAAKALVAVRRRTGRPIPQRVVDLANSPD